LVGPEAEARAASQQYLPDAPAGTMFCTPTAHCLAGKIAGKLMQLCAANKRRD
jgi:hypothetical protein